MHFICLRFSDFFNELILTTTPAIIISVSTFVYSNSPLTFFSNKIPSAGAGQRGGCPRSGDIVQLPITTQRTRVHSSVWEMQI